MVPKYTERSQVRKHSTCDITYEIVTQSIYRFSYEMAKEKKTSNTGFIIFFFFLSSPYRRCRRSDEHPPENCENDDKKQGPGTTRYSEFEGEQYSILHSTRLPRFGDSADRRHAKGESEEEGSCERSLQRFHFNGNYLLC